MNTISDERQSREERMIVLERDETGRPTVWCDPEIADIVGALNRGGVRTVASCSGHGNRPGSIALADGRWLVIAKDDAELDQIEAIFTTDINGEPTLRAQGGVASLEASPAPVSEEIEADRAWECKDFADGWIRFENLEGALAYQSETGCVMRPTRALAAKGGQ